MKPTIIAISGWKRSGKDTVAEYLRDNFGAKRLAFADPLKHLVSDLFGIDRRNIDNPSKKEAPILTLPVLARDAFSQTVTEFMTKEFRDDQGRNYGNSSMYWTPRALCILIGSAMRSADPDYWVKKAVSQAEPGQLYVISDARYKNEINSLKATGANVITLRINRFDTSPSNDPSERDLDNFEFDSVISNRGTLDDLYLAVASSLEGKL
jgi:hypothetical protein